MTDALGRELGAWLPTIDAQPADPATSLRRAMANTARTPQASRSRLAASLSREVIPSEPARSPSVHHSDRVGRYGSVHVTSGGTSRMVIAATAMAVTTAFVLAGSLLLGGVIQGPAPQPVGPSQAPATEGPSVLVGTETARNDDFELTISTPRTTWSTDESIQVTTSLAYRGQEPRTLNGSGGDIVLFEIDQLDGPVDTDEPPRDLACGVPHDFAAGDVQAIPFRKGGSWDREGPLASFWADWLDDPELRLPAGTYRIVAHGHYGSPPRCDTSALKASVTIEVVAPPPSPMPSAEATGRVVLAPPVVASSEQVLLDTDRRPDARVTRNGVRLEVWVPQEPLVAGEILPVGVRVTNVGRRPIRYAGDRGALSCHTGHSGGAVRLRFANLYDPGISQTGNAAILKEELLSSFSLGSLGLDAIEVVRGGPAKVTCTGDIGVESTLRPGASFSQTLGVLPRYGPRAQPLPGGEAEVGASFAFWRPRRAGQPQGPISETRLEVTTPVAFVGEPVDYPSPGQLVDAAFAVPELEAFVEQADLSDSWNVTMGWDGPAGAELDWDAPDDLAGSPAPLDELDLGISASAGSLGSFASIVLDPWTGEVLGEVELQ